MPNIEEVANAIVGDAADIAFSITSELEMTLRDYENEDAIEMTRAFVHLRRVKDSLEDLDKKVSKIYEDWKTNKVPAKLDGAGLPTINLAEGYRVTVVHNVRASVRPERREAAYEWLREHGLADLITNTVNASTLSAVAKDMATDNQELDPELFNVHVIPTTSVTTKK